MYTVQHVIKEIVTRQSASRALCVCVCVCVCVSVCVCLCVCTCAQALCCDGPFATGGACSNDSSGSPGSPGSRRSTVPTCKVAQLLSVPIQGCTPCKSHRALLADGKLNNEETHGVLSD